MYTELQVLRLECPYCNKWNPISICKVVCVHLQNEFVSRVVCAATRDTDRHYSKKIQVLTIHNVRYHLMHSHMFHKDSSSNSCSSLTKLTIRSFLSHSFLLHSLSLSTSAFFAEYRNPFGLCRKCLAIW